MVSFQKQPPRRCSIKKVFFSEAATQEVFYKKGILENFAKFIAGHLSPTLIFSKVAGLKHLVEHYRWLLLSFSRRFLFETVKIGV